MKELITTDLGGQPVYFKDFEFIQEQIRELAKTSMGLEDNSIVTLMNKATINVSTDGYTIEVVTEGWAWYNGEMFRVPVQSATGSSPNVAKWRIKEEWDSRGLKTFKDETVGAKNVYLVRTLELGYYSSGAEGVLFSTTKFPHDYSPWTKLALGTYWADFTTFTEYPGFWYRKNAQGHLELMVAIYNTQTLASSNYSTIGVLPEGYRPKNIIKKHISPDTYSSNHIYWYWSIYPNGEITFYTSNLNTPGRIMDTFIIILEQ